MMSLSDTGGYVENGKMLYSPCSGLPTPLSAKTAPIKANNLAPVVTSLFR
jgi:hypothetical protein